MHVFRNPLRLTRQDRIEGREERWQTIGVVHGVTVLLIAHTIREEMTGAEDEEAVEEIRIISARRTLQGACHAKGKDVL